MWISWTPLLAQVGQDRKDVAAVDREEVADAAARRRTRPTSAPPSTDAGRGLAALAVERFPQSISGWHRRGDTAATGPKGSCEKRPAAPTPTGSVLTLRQNEDHRQDAKVAKRTDPEMTARGTHWRFIADGVELVFRRFDGAFSLLAILASWRFVFRTSRLICRTGERSLDVGRVSSAARMSARTERLE